MLNSALTIILDEHRSLAAVTHGLRFQDWVEIAQALGTNGDPRFGAEPDHEFRSLFSRIVNLAQTPIGVGPSA
ncbi:MAG: hypothetical protein FJY34_12125 [Betaproteobacteria bacterium]|nr:hypothetical protein [Betaproteobacteria bacterium]